MTYLGIDMIPGPKVLRIWGLHQNPVVRGLKLRLR